MEHNLIDLLKGKIEIEEKAYNVYGLLVTNHFTNSVGIDIIEGGSYLIEVIYNPEGLEVYFYKTIDKRDGHRYSRYYTNFLKVPKKYSKEISLLKNAYEKIFGKIEENI